MKISIDGILGSANSIINKRNNENKNPDELKSASGDTIEIGSRVNSRLNAIDSDLRNIQNSLSLNQTLREALKEIYAELQAGRSGDSIIKNTTFNNQPVLADLFKGKDVTESSVRQMLANTEENVHMDVAKLTRIQIETENIFASNLASGDVAEKVFKNTETVYVGGQVSASNRLTMLNADVVMRLIK